MVYSEQKYNFFQNSGRNNEQITPNFMEMVLGTSDCANCMDFWTQAS